MSLVRGRPLAEEPGIGALTIPGYLRDYASLNGEVLIAGMETFLELWQPESWRATLDDVTLVLSEAEHLLKIGI